jgi:hypothetical protein
MKPGTTINAPNGTAVDLDYLWYDRHIGGHRKNGPEKASVFEIKRAIEKPENYYPSKKNPERTVFNAECGTLAGTKWHTVVLTEAINKMVSNVVTAYNTMNYQNK